MTFMGRRTNPSAIVKLYECLIENSMKFLKLVMDTVDVMIPSTYKLRMYVLEYYITEMNLNMTEIVNIIIK